MIKTPDEVLILINPASNPHGPTARHLHGATSRIQLPKSLDSNGWRRYCRSTFIYLHSTMIEFRLDSTSGVTTYWQLVQQVRQAIRVGRLKAGDQLPTVREVVAKLAINPNTVLKAYRELERDDLVASRPGQGTFVTRAARAMSPTAHAALRRSLERWVRTAREAGLDTESIRAIVATTLQESEGKLAIR